MASAAVCSVPFDPKDPKHVHCAAQPEVGTVVRAEVGDTSCRGGVDKKTTTLQARTLEQTRSAHPRRRGCHHCIACAGLEYHCHSTTVRSSQSAAAEWWPGGIHSTAVYFHLRARQLRHLMRLPPTSNADGKVQPQWRSEVTDVPSTLLNRRFSKALPDTCCLMLLVPNTSTNVAVGDGVARFVGTAVLPMRSRSMSDAHQKPEVETKRRCTQAAGQSVAALNSSSSSNSNSNLNLNSSTIANPHLNLQHSPFHGTQGPIIFPGVVLDCSSGPSQAQHAQHCTDSGPLGLQRAISSTSMLGVVTPPVGVYTGVLAGHQPSSGCLYQTQSWNQNQVLLSASSDTSTSTVTSTSLSAPSVSTLGSMEIADSSFGSFIQQHQHQMSSVPIPILLMQPGGVPLQGDDPAVQRYLNRQYSI
jgi:hypothetical protein